jgi:hypothetical protein
MYSRIIPCLHKVHRRTVRAVARMQAYVASVVCFFPLNSCAPLHFLTFSKTGSQDKTKINNSDLVNF